MRSCELMRPGAKTLQCASSPKPPRPPPSPQTSLNGKNRPNRSASSTTTSCCSFIPGAQTSEFLFLSVARVPFSPFLLEQLFLSILSFCGNSFSLVFSILLLPQPFLAIQLFLSLPTASVISIIFYCGEIFFSLSQTSF